MALGKRPHCTRCGRYLDKQPDNAFGWCGTCEAMAAMGWPQPEPQPEPQPAVPAPAPWPVAVPSPMPMPQPWTPPIVWWQAPTTIITTGTPLPPPAPVWSGTGYSPTAINVCASAACTSIEFAVAPSL